MSDYQLERLNTRSFEQLVQALALEVIGHRVTVFGDGPDGGREAAFRGPVDFPVRTKAWDGHGIVQAKFRQQPFHLAHKNADWALAELKAEFKKFEPQPRRRAKGAVAAGARTCPDYYIFATNLALSPAMKSGGKDRVAAFLDACKRTHGLVDYVIWDGDQMGRMLDAHPGIRTSFLPFVLPGDVLSEVMQCLKPRRADFASVMLRHLQLELLDDQFAKLSQGGYVNANRVSLSNVFVDLPIEGGPGIGDTQPDDDMAAQRATILRRLFAEADCVLRPSLRIDQPSAASPKGRNTVPGRIVVIGGPGQGKTTVGLFACQIMRASLLREATRPYDREVQQAMDEVKLQADTLPPLSTLRYPLRVDLKRLAEALASEADGRGRVRTLLGFLVGHISKRTGTSVELEDFRLWLRSYPWLLVLDGLDEVPASSNRTLMMDAINDFIRIEAYQEDADLMVVATTRPQGYSDEFDPGNYAHLSLLPLLPHEALAYGERLAAARYASGDPRVEEISGRLKKATASAATARLMESPLQVTIMLAIAELSGDPPEQRWQLFDQYYSTIFRREKERGTPFSKVLREYEADIHWIHHRAGWMLQQRNAEPGKTAARLSHDEFDALVRERLIWQGHGDDAALAALVKQMREAATDRLVLLVGNTEHEIGFEIRSLQEFMAAEHVFDGDDDGVRKTLGLIAPHSYWRNVFLFMSGRIFFKRESLVDSLVAICDHLNEPFNNDPALAQIQAGSQLAFALLADDVCRRQPANTRRLARLAARLLGAPIGDEAVLLSQLFRREAGTILREELVSRLDEPKLAYGAWRVCIELAREGVAWARESLVEKFPWRSEELDGFLSFLFDTQADLGHFFRYQIARNLRYIGAETVRAMLTLRVLQEHIDPGIAQALEYLSRPAEFDLLAADGRALHIGIFGTFALSPYLGLRMRGHDFSDAHADWQHAAAAAEFIADPTVKTLCRQLDIALGIQSRTDDNFLLPWQFDVCIAAARSGIDVGSILQEVAGGGLGGPADWNRWAALRELSIADLGDADEHLCVSDRSLGKMLRRSRWHHRETDKSKEMQFLGEMTDAFTALRPGAAISDTLIQLACFGLNRVAPDLDGSDVGHIGSFLDAASRQGHGIGREIITAILCSRIPIAAQLELLQKCNARMFAEYWITLDFVSPLSLDTAWTAAWAAALAAGKEQDILPALAALPPLGEARRVAQEVLQRASQGDEAHRNAAMLIRLGAQCWTAEEAGEVAEDVLRLVTTQQRWLIGLISYIDGMGLHGEHLEALILELHKRATPAHDRTFGPHWNRLLARIVDRRPAPTVLPDPSPPRAPARGGRH